MQKKIISMILCLITILSSFNLQIIYSSDGTLKDKFYKEGIPQMDKREGNIGVWFSGQKATSSIRYHTIGYTVHPSVDSNLKAYYTQNKATLIGSGFTQRENDYDLGNGRVGTDFIMSYNAVTNALISSGQESKGNGDTIYLDGIFELVINGKSNGKKYYSYDEISKAAAWSSATMQDLKKHYNLPVTVQVPSQNLYVKYFVDGIEVKEDFKGIGSFEVGKATTNVTADDKYVKDNKYTFVRSYFTYNNVAGMSYDDPRAMVNETNGYTRNPVMVNGGMTVNFEFQTIPITTIKDIPYIVQYVDIDKTPPLIMKQETKTAQMGSSVTEKASNYSTPKNFVSSQMSYSGGLSFGATSYYSLVTETINQTGIVFRFNFSSSADSSGGNNGSGGGVTAPDKFELNAVLNLSVNPSCFRRSVFRNNCKHQRKYFPFQLPLYCGLWA